MIPADQCQPLSLAGVNIEKDRAYVSVTIDELILGSDRRLWTSFNPIVFVVTRLIYDGRLVAVPTILGPTLLSGHSMVRDKRVAGPYPYRGGPISVAIGLYYTPHQDYVHRLVRMLERLSAEMGQAADIESFSTIGDLLIEGLETVMNVDNTKLLASAQVELHETEPKGPGSSFALLLGAKDVPDEKFRVVDKRLHILGDAGELAPYDEDHYLLYSVTASDRRDDVSELPFYPLVVPAQPGVNTVPPCRTATMA
jgi:hypothetical protein